MNIEEIKAQIAKPEYDFLRTNEHLGENIILLTLGGSHAYGLETETSDLDIRGIALNSKREILLGRYFEQVLDNVTDTTVYSFNKIITLLTNCNPNTIELLGCRPEQYLILTPIGKSLIDNRKMFLSQRCVHTFGGYANSQLRRLGNKSARLVSQAENEKYILNSINNAKYDFKTRYFPADEDSINLYIDKAVTEGYDSEIFMDVNLKHYPLRDWAGMWNEMKSIVSSYNKIGKRNENAIKRDKLGKHMAHLIRLYMMCIDILEKEEIITYRSEEHDLLMSIRRGEFLDENRQPTDDFWELLDEYEKRFEYAKKNTSLPEQPNYKQIDEFTAAINERVVKGELQKRSVKISLPDDVKEIFSVISDCGANAYVVGGCVRDSIMGRTPHDWDICTSAPVTELQREFEKRGYRVIPTGLKHGTITVNLNDNNYEITTFRKDGAYSDGRHPDSIEFTDDLITDLARRDFTINAMAYNEQSGLVDPFGGYDDIQNKIIRCVGDPDERFREDGLRILRAIRFAAQLEFTIDEKTEASILYNRELIRSLSRERIQSEFCKILMCRKLQVYLYNFSGVFFDFIPELADLAGFDQKNPYHVYDGWQHTLVTLEMCSDKDLITKLAALFHDIGKPHCYVDGEDGIRHFYGHPKVSADMADAIMRRLKFDNYTRESVIQLVSYHDALIQPKNKSVRRWINRIGKEQFERLIDMQRADVMAHSQLSMEEKLETLDMIEQCYKEVLNEKPSFSVKDLEVNGDDVMTIMDIPAGKDVGYWLNDVLNKVLDGELNNNREDLIHYLQRKRQFIESVTKKI